ncbi:hypothetical protein [Erythrobacter rubeus]|uniref:Uncharacterized protein n=1 Tax=Erythrobacter rubeus TaxID=2760803 RepID=A0ABR8KS35_9SPHN|nr:hypothetical protein [Erythrobacter rubeus]MBD2840986.1 hypothetical protein [Erythrobacter rubeus]
MTNTSTWTTRRKILLGIGASSLVGTAILGGRIAYAKPEDLVSFMTKRALPNANIPDRILKEFSADYVSGLRANRLENLNTLVLLSAGLTAGGIDALLSSTEKYKNFRRTAVTQFMVRSNFFATEGGKTAPLEYYGRLTCGLNPFARFG